MVASSSYKRTRDHDSEYITVAIDVHTAFVHADIDRDLFAEPPR